MVTDLFVTEDCLSIGPLVAEISETLYLHPRRYLPYPIQLACDRTSVRDLAYIASPVTANTVRMRRASELR